jgi:cobalt-zinc-cadmium efflux system membrane fusion protein
MATRGTFNLRTAVLALGVLSAAAAVVVYFGVTNNWWRGQPSDVPQKAAESSAMPDLVRDGLGRPVKPFAIRLSKTTAQALKVTSGQVRPAGPLLLPPQVGALGYDTDRLYAVRPRFAGEVIEIAKVKEAHRLDGSAEKVEITRLVGPGDWVDKGQPLAVLWSKELGDRKVIYISALLDLYLDRELLNRQESAYLSGALSEASYQGLVNKVEKDLSAVFSAENSLGIARLTPAEIEAIRTEAKILQKRLKGKPETPAQRKLRLREDVKKWARVEILAPYSGRIVEKNTNLSDQVDPINSPPMFRVADMSTLLINANFNEEYLPLLQPLLRDPQRGWFFINELYQLFGMKPPPEGNGELRWKIHIEAATQVPVLDLPVLRIAPSLDPNNHTAMVIGRIANPVKDRQGQDKHLVVGQFVTATVAVPPIEDTVDIPTNALNEVNGESLVLVQPDPAKTEYALRRVAVVRRSLELTQVRSKLTPQEKALSEEEVRQGRRPIEPLQVGERLVTHGVTEITDAFEALLAKERVEKK